MYPFGVTLRRRYRLLVTCRDTDCRHSQTLDRMGLAKRYGPTVPLALIVRRLRGTACGACEPEITIGVEGR